MDKIKKEDAKNLYDLIEHEARERQRLEAERRDRAKRIFNPPKIDTLNRTKGENKQDIHEWICEQSGQPADIHEWIKTQNQTKQKGEKLEWTKNKKN